MGKTNYGFYLIGGGLAFVVGALSWIFVFAPEDDNKSLGYARGPVNSSGNSSSGSRPSSGSSGYQPDSERVSNTRESENEPYALNGGSRRRRKSRKSRKSRNSRKSRKSRKQ